MPAKTAKQVAAQERFRAAAKQAKREGKKGKSFAKRVGELLRGRGSSGAGHKTSSGRPSGGHPSGSGHGGGGMSEKSKPKPRLAIWGGTIASAGALAGVEGMRPAGFYELPTKRGQTLVSQATANIGKATTTLSGAVAVAAPTVVGTLLSLAADKLGVNKRLARARMPFRV